MTGVVQFFSQCFPCCSMNSSTEISRSAKREAISKRMSKLKVGGKIRYFFLTCEKNRLRFLIGQMIFFTYEESHLNHARHVSQMSFILAIADVNIVVCIKQLLNEVE